MSNIDALTQVFEMLSASRQADIEAYNPENVRYVLYSRKSTTDEGRQEKSIGDQIADCLDRVVKPNNIVLTDADIIEEKGSAKEPDIRPKFRQMLNDIKRDKYDGIIAWHPDRLARNMREAGEIIDLLDKGIIKDLRFATSAFENSPTGKMLLGISFVLSKQYSEHLSEMVSRGNRRMTEKGLFIGKYKHGYAIEKDGYLYPDGNNYSVIKQAFDMRIDNQSQADIQRYLNSRKDYRTQRKNGDARPYVWDKDSVSKLLRDPFYCGVLLYGTTPSMLREQYDFTPAISPEDFLLINNASGFTSKVFKSARSTPRAGVKANLLRGIVTCYHCKKPFSSGITIKSNGERYYRYRCETSSCEMHNKGPRAKVVTDYAIDYLAEHHFTTKNNYEHYQVEVSTNIVKRKSELNSLAASLNRELQELTKSYENAKRIAADPQSPLAKHYVGDLDTTQSKIEQTNKLIKANQVEKDSLKTLVLTYEKYLELFSNVSVILRSNSSIEVLNKILSKFYSNLEIKGELIPPKMAVTRWKVSSHVLREPYKTFDKNNDFDLGRGDRT